MPTQSSGTFRSDLGKILEIVLAFNFEGDYAKLLEIILDKMMELTYSDAGTLYILDENELHFRILKNNTLGISRIINPEDDDRLPPIALNENNIENVSAYSAIHNETIIIEDVYGDKHFNFQGPKKYDEMTGYRTRSMLVMPLLSDYYYKGEPEVLGVIQLLNAVNPATNEPMAYKDIYDPSLTAALSRLTANTLANLIHMREIHQLFQSLIQVLTVALDERSSATKHHTQNVAKYCESYVNYLSETFPDESHYLHFDMRHRERLVIAALLHDIGKIITPTRVLDKSTRLFESQFRDIMQRFAMKKHQIEIDYLKGKSGEEEYVSALNDIHRALELIEQINLAKPISDEEHEAVLKMSDIMYANVEGDIVPILDEKDMQSLTVMKGTLTDDERLVMQDHVITTGMILDQITSLKHYKWVSKWTKDHHEFLDGSGYPAGLTSDQIEIETQIITMMDIFEALTTDERPYRKGMPAERALNILREMAEEGKLNKELVHLLADSKIWI